MRKDVNNSFNAQTQLGGEKDFSFSLLRSALFQIHEDQSSYEKLQSKIAEEQKKKLKCLFPFSFVDQKVVPCFSILARKYDIVEMDIVGRSEKMAKLPEKIT